MAARQHRRVIIFFSALNLLGKKLSILLPLLSIGFLPVLNLIFFF